MRHDRYVNASLRKEARLHRIILVITFAVLVLALGAAPISRA